MVADIAGHLPLLLEPFPDARAPEAMCRSQLTLVPPLPREPAPELHLPEDRWLEIWAHRSLLLSVARGRVAAHEAEDIVSEAMLRASVHPEIPAESLRAWLATTTVHLCADAHRGAVREERRRQRMAIVLPSAEPGPEQSVVDTAEGSWFASQIRRLPERQAEALLRRAMGDEIGAIALAMGLSYKTVESLLSRARRTMRSFAAAVIAAFAVGRSLRTLTKRKAQVHIAVVAMGTTYEVLGSTAGGVARVAASAVWR